MILIFQKYWWLVAVFLTAVIIAIQQAIVPKDGMNASGFYDDDTEGGILKSQNSNPTVTYKQAPIKMQNFNISEFDSPDQKGSGENMNVQMLQKLDMARTKAGIPFKINSGYRTIAHNKTVGGVGDSAHTRGYACDISAKTDVAKQTILKACYDAGFRRFGYYGTFIHVDIDPDKPSPTIWKGDGVTIKYNPLTA